MTNLQPSLMLAPSRSVSEIGEEEIKPCCRSHPYCRRHQLPVINRSRRRRRTMATSEWGKQRRKINEKEELKFVEMKCCCGGWAVVEEDKSEKDRSMVLLADGGELRMRLEENEGLDSSFEGI
ncbi:unnamed protein product [Cuscuta epithymum]|uniref:Uncharacterized protein n=1 Tax=Cuscuta epithymum TaxID=186058 RepID=A0AAV0DFC6_9ASTE|nr:unnamed protein product [Cuscuta epithymum]CAH9132592.1 unnamed protein product [Cuscuta epithymum]